MISRPRGPGDTLAEAGRRAEARAIADALRDVPAGTYVPYCELASAYIRLGDTTQAFRLFDEALERRDPALKHLAGELLYDPVREATRTSSSLRGGWA